MPSTVKFFIPTERGQEIELLFYSACFRSAHPTWRLTPPLLPGKHPAGKLPMYQGDAMAQYTLLVNGIRREVEAWDGDMPLLYVLRDSLGLPGAKVRLRARPMRRVHGARRRQGGAVVLDGASATSPGRPSPPSKASARRNSRTRCRPRSSPSRPRSAATAPTGWSWPARRCSAQPAADAASRRSRRWPATSAAAARTADPARGDARRGRRLGGDR